MAVEAFVLNVEDAGGDGLIEAEILLRGGVFDAFDIEDRMAIALDKNAVGARVPQVDGARGRAVGVKLEDDLAVGE